MEKITMGDDEFILYIRKQHKNCEINTQEFGRQISVWMKKQGLYEPKDKKEELCLWVGSSNIDGKNLPEYANQYTFDRSWLPKIYDQLDEIGNKNITNNQNN